MTLQLDAVGRMASALARVQRATSMLQELRSGAIVLAGDELGEFPETPDGLKALRQAARDYLMTLRGKWIDCPALGRKVEVRKRSIGEMMAFSANPLKLKLIPAIEHVIRTAPGPVEREVNAKHLKSSTLAYYRLRHRAVIGSSSVSFILLIEEDLHGMLHYDFILDAAPKAEAAMDCSNAASLSPAIHDTNSWVRDDSNVSPGGLHVKAEGVLDAAESGVLNLFIVGQDAIFDGLADPSILAPKVEAIAGAVGLERVRLTREVQGLLAEPAPGRDEALRRWFGASKIVDDDGKPLVMYHGSYKDFSQFNRLASAWRGQSIDMVGSWFSSVPGDGGAGMYASGAGAIIYPVYLKVERPKYYESFRELLNAMHEAEGRDPAMQNPPGKGSPEGLRELLKSQGYDGIALSQTNVGEQEADLAEVVQAIKRAKDEEFSVPRAERAPYTAKRERLEGTAKRLRAELATYGGSTEFDRQSVVIVFEPEQIKSAIGNAGTFDPSSPSMLDSAASPLARLRLVTTLRAKVEQYAGAGNAIQRVRLVQEIRVLLAELGAGSAKESPHVALLREVVAGEHDTEGLAEHYGMIQEAINALEEAGELSGEVEALAHQAITHWAEHEEEING